jgi:hypothetical protein
VFPIIGNVALKFFIPEGFVAFRDGGVFTAFMPVPETAVDKNHCPVLRQYDIRFVGQGVVLQKRNKTLFFYFPEWFDGGDPEVRGRKKEACIILKFIIVGRSG